MTLPDQRTRAVLSLSDQVLALMPYLRGTGPGALVPRGVLQDLLRTLRHYPTTYDLARSAEAAPDIWAKPQEPRL